MKKKSIFLIALFAMCMCFGFNAYANESFDGQGDVEVKAGEEKTLNVDSTGDNGNYNCYNNFDPQESGFYDLTIKTDKEVRVQFRAEMATKDDDERPARQFFEVEKSGTWKNVCYFKKGQNYSLYFVCYEKGNERKETKAKVTYSISKSKSSVEKLTSSKKSVNAKGADRLVYSFETGKTSSMYSIIFDTDKEYSAIVVPQNRIAGDLTDYTIWSNCNTVGKSYDTKLDANTKYYIIYYLCDTNVSDDTKYNASICIKKRNVAKVDVKFASDSIYSFEMLHTKKYKCSVTYDDKTTYSVTNYMNNLFFLDWDGDVLSKSEGLTPVGKNTLTGKYFGKKFTTTVNVKSFYKYAKEHGKTLTLGTTENIGKVGEYVGFYTITPSKSGFYDKSDALANWLSFTTDIKCYMVDSNDKEVKYVDSVGYNLKANKEYAFYVKYEYYEKDKKDFKFSLDYKAHEHKVEILKAVEATYTHTGKTQGSRCSICGEILVEQKTIPKKQLKATKLTSLTYKLGILSKWNKVQDATGYEVYRKVGKSGKYVKIATCSSKTLKYTDKKVKKSRYKKTYYYAIKAIRTEKVAKKNVTVKSAYSNVKSIKR